MIYLTIEEKKYKIPNGYKDISLGKFKKIQQFLDSDYNKSIVESIVEGTVKNDKKALEFYIDFINYVTDIPTKLLKKCTPYGKDSLQSSFEVLSFLLFKPAIENPQPVKILNGYHFIDKLDYAHAIMKDNDYIEYMESSIVNEAINDLSKGVGRYEQLNNLLAIMYRPMIKKNWFSKAKIEVYDSDKVRERAKEFDDIDMNTVWNCLFFFTLLKIESLKNINLSLEKELEKAQKG